MVPTSELAQMLRPLPSGIGELTRRVVAMVAAHPGLSGQVRGGWRSIDFRHREAGMVCAIYPHADSVALYFDPDASCDAAPAAGNCKGSQFLTLLPQAEIPLDAIGAMLSQAIALRA